MLYLYVHEEGERKEEEQKKEMNERQADRQKEEGKDISRGRRGRASPCCGAREALARGPRPQEGRAGISSRPGEQTLTRLRCFLRTRRTGEQRLEAVRRAAAREEHATRAVLLLTGWFREGRNPPIHVILRVELRWKN